MAFADLSAHFDEAQVLKIMLTEFYRTVAYHANALALLPEPSVARFYLACGR